MPRVAFLLPDFRIGGAERVALSLIEQLVKRGIEVDLVLLRQEGELLKLLPPGVHLVPLDAGRIRQAIRPLAAYLRNRRPDALQARMWPLTIAAILARLVARSNARLVVSDDNNLARAYAERPLLVRTIGWSMRLFYPLAEVRLAVSGDLAGQLARLSGLDLSRFTIVGNPVASPPERLGPNPDIERLWTGTERRIITVGTLKRQKNHALLLRAVARLERPANLMIVGEGELRGELERLARELGIADQVAMPGSTLDLWPYYASAQLFVLSSDYEGFGNVLVEAMAMGLPVVSTDCESGPREILDGGRFGRLVSVGNVEGLSAAIGQALDDAPDRSALKARARAFRPEAVADRYLELLLG